MQDNEEILELTKKQKLVQRVVAIVLIALGGLFLLLCGLIYALPHILTILAATILFTFFLVFLFCGIVGKNPVSIWISLAFFTPFIIEVLTNLNLVTYAQIYPLYIAIPFVVSLVTGAIWRNLKPHAWVLTLFGGLAAIFSLQSSGLFNQTNISPWAVVIPLASVLFVGCVVWVVIKLTRKK